MISITNQLRERLQELKAIIQKISLRLQNVPEGTLDIYTVDNKTRYRWRHRNPENKKMIRTYLDKSHQELIQALAQKSYDEKVLNIALKQARVIESFLRGFELEALEQLYANLSQERRALIEADVVDKETFIANWERVTYKPDEQNPITTEFFTMRNEHVRSKSEKIIADTLLQRNLPYRYEPPTIIIPGKKPWRPDFVVLNRQTCKQMIWEHLGMMDDTDYCLKNLRKIKKYQQAGFFQGDNILFTFEATDMPLSTIDINLIIDKYFDNPDDEKQPSVIGSLEWN